MNENIKDERIQLRVSKEQKHKLKVLASINDMNISTYISYLVERELENNSYLNSLMSNCVTTLKKDIKSKEENIIKKKEDDLLTLKYTYDNKRWYKREFKNMFTLETFIDVAKDKKPIIEYKILNNKE